MGFFDNIKGIVGLDTEEEEITEEDQVKSNDMTKITPASDRPEPRNVRTAESTIHPSSASSAGSNTARFTSQWKMVVNEPTDFNDCPKLVDSLKAKKPVIINLENTETDVARKIFDFLSGATYALNGNVQKVANNIFIFAPENVDVSHSQSQKNTERNYKSPWK